MSDDDIPATNDLLEAFRRKKEEAAKATGETEPSSPEDAGPPSVDIEDAPTPSPKDATMSDQDAVAALQEAVEEDRPLEDHSASELRDMATGKGIDISSARSKTDLVNAIRDHDQGHIRTDYPGAPDEDQETSAGPAIHGDDADTPVDEEEHEEELPELEEEAVAEPPPSTADESSMIDAVATEPIRPNPTGELQSLSPMDPGLGLKDRLQQDHKVTVPGTSWISAVGWIIAILGAASVATDLWMDAVRGVVFIGPLRLVMVGGILLLVGGASVVAMRFVKTERRIAVRFRASQVDEWQSADQRVRRLTIMRWISVGIAAAGPFWAIGAYALGATSNVPIITAAGLLTVGAAMTGATHAMHRTALRVYIQTTVLMVLERNGLAPRGAAAPDSRSAMDGRVGPVLRSLDALLGALPDAEVQAFLQTPEAATYLELMDSLQGP